MFGRYGWRDLTTFDEPPCRCRRAARATAISTRATSSWRSAPPTRRADRRCSKCASAGRRRRAARTRRRSARPAPRRLRHQPACRPTRASPAACRRSSSPAIPISAGRRPTRSGSIPTVCNPKLNYSWLRGRHSLKAGYEFQHIDAKSRTSTRCTAATPTPASSRARPAPRPSTLYNLSDFMLGLRSQYALSNILVANLRQNMHFAYLQDDCRVNDALTLNLGLRYEYATPHLGSEQRPVELRSGDAHMVLARDGSLDDRALVDPDRNNFGPRLGFAYTMTPKTVSAAATASATSTSTAPAAPTCCRSTARRSSTPSSTRSNPRGPGVPADRARISGRPHRSVALQPAAREHHLHARATYQSSRGAELVRVGAAGVRPRHAARRRVRRQQGATTCCCSPTSTRRCRTTPPARCRCRRAGRFRRIGDITYSSTAACRATTRCRCSSSGAAQRLIAPELADAVAGEGQRRRLAREPQRQFPGAAGLLQSGRRIGLSATTSRTTTPPASCGRCRSDAVGAGASGMRRRWTR